MVGLKQNRFEKIRNAKKIEKNNANAAKQMPAGAPYCHFPEYNNTEYFKQLTAEQLVTRIVKGYPKQGNGRKQGTATKHSIVEFSQEPPLLLSESTVGHMQNRNKSSEQKKKLKTQLYQRKNLIRKS